MTTIYKILALITIFGSNIHGHGFAKGTLVASCRDRWHCMDKLFHNKNARISVLTYKFSKQHPAHCKVVDVQAGTTNCYMRIGLDDDRSHDIICTPSQEFYLPELDIWMDACSLQVGDKLLSFFQKKRITSVKFVAESCNIYVMEVDDPHTFLSAFMLFLRKI